MSHSFLITTLHPSLLTHLIQPPPPLSFLLCIPLKLPFSSPLPSRLAPPLLPPPPLSLYLCISFKLHFSSLLLSNFPSVSPQQSFPLLSSPPPAPSLLFFILSSSSTFLSSAPLPYFPSSYPPFLFSFLLLPPPITPSSVLPSSLLSSLPLSLLFPLVSLTFTCPHISSHPTGLISCSALPRLTSSKQLCLSPFMLIA